MARRRFSREIKFEAVRLVREQGVSVAQAARDLDVHENVLRKWVRGYESDSAHAFPGQGQLKPEQAEIAALKREIQKLKAERDILKKSRGLLREGIEVRFGFVAKHRGIWPLRWMCEVLDVSPSGFYGWLSRPPSRRCREDQELVRHVRRSFTESGETYGARRVWPDLLAWGYAVGRERVARLMRQEGLQARQPKRKLPRDNGQRPAHALAPNLLNRTFTAGQPNQRWVADFTYIWATEGWLYVAVVLDLFSRRVVGWSMKAHMSADLVTDALLMAIWRRGPAGSLLHHSDQGSQYTSDKFQRLLAEHGIDCSMSRRGDCWNNAAVESFFSSLKSERVARKTYRNRDEARADVFDYIERFYNPRRRHSTLGYRVLPHFHGRLS